MSASRVSSWMIASCVVAALVLGLAGCGKEDGDGADGRTPTTGPAIPPVLAPTAEPATQPTAEPAAAPAPETQAAAPTGGDELVPLEIESARPMFIGTPKNIPPGTTVEQTTGPREPFLAPKGVKNVAAGRPVTASDTPIVGTYAQVTDGDKEAVEGSQLVLGPGKTWVQIDLGAQYDIYAIVVWHQHSDPRVYRDVVVKVSKDPDFIEVTTVFNNDQDNSIGEGLGKDREYFETNEGKLIDAKGVTGRYVRLYSNGSTADDLNLYAEVEVYGLPAK